MSSFGSMDVKGGLRKDDGMTWSMTDLKEDDRIYMVAA